MEPKAAMASSPPPHEGQLLQRSEANSQLSTIVFDLSQQVQAAMENMLKMINEIDENSTGIMEGIAKCKDNALERRKTLEEQKENFQKAAFTVLDILNNKDI
ncbi:Kinectin like [Actinidia chinensis var. chinensis]|uniref:Kinectin like n=1 Tax=Actinidia chinensis var. chinensis TaxID=1590841 RepID=A0A2R6PIU0_ACTCC|nr:Kinectin like [Actinidia chinensis var. chinensis]